MSSPFLGPARPMPGEELPSDDLTSLLLQESTSLAPSDLDNYLTELYNYYTNSGFHGTITNSILDLTSLAFLWFLFLFLALGVDWAQLSACAPNCENHSLLTFNSHSNFLYVFMAWSFLLVLGGFFAWRLLSFGLRFKQLIAMHNFVSNDLGIKDREIATVDFSFIVQKLVENDASGKCTVFREKHSELDVLSRIMRRDNYWIALHDARDTLMRSWVAVPILDKRISGMSSTLETAIRTAFIEPMFTYDFRLDENFITGPQIARGRLKWIGAVCLVFAPFIACYVIIRAIAKNIDILRRDPASAGTKAWTLQARSLFREYNELPHELDKRLTRAKPSADAYVDKFVSAWVVVVARFLSFVLGCIVAVLLAMGLANEEMLEIKVAGRNLIWFLGVSGTALAVARRFSTTPVHTKPPAEDIQDVAKDTHFLPKRWLGKEHAWETYSEFNRLYTYSLYNTLQEVIGVFVTPYLCLIELPKQASSIVAFLQNCTVHRDSVGCVCSFADFRFDRHGNPRYGSKHRAAKRMQASEDGKMEKSFLSFNLRYPQCQANDAAEEYRRDFVTHLKADSDTSPMASTYGPPGTQSGSVSHVAGTGIGEVGGSRLIGQGASAGGYPSLSFQSNQPSMSLFEAEARAAHHKLLQYHATGALPAQNTRAGDMDEEEDRVFGGL